jgi:hypothetical protein
MAVVYAASIGALQIHWSDSILDETTRNLIGKSIEAVSDCLDHTNPAPSILFRLRP